MSKDHMNNDDLTQRDLGRLEQTGLEMTMNKRSGSFFQKDQHIVHAFSDSEGIEVLTLRDALEKYSWIDEYYWNAVPQDKDRFTRFVARQKESRGMVIIAHEGAKAIYPIQACLYLAGGAIQHVHNIIIAEKGAELHFISGCASATTEQRGAHYGITECYVKEDAKVTSTMIHNWGKKINVFPRTAAIVDDRGTFMSNYICLQPVGRINMYPTAYLRGENSIGRFSSITVSHPGAHLDLGSRAILSGKGSSAELLTRAITTGGTTISRGHIRGEIDGTRGHIECKGLILEDGLIHAIPEIEGNVTGTELSHEAAVGKIARQEIEYLMARGLDEETATSTIIRGFLDVKIKGLPDVLQKQIDAAIDAAETGF